MVDGGEVTTVIALPQRGEVKLREFFETPFCLYKLLGIDIEPKLARTYREKVAKALKNIHVSLILLSLLLILISQSIEMILSIDLNWNKATVIFTSLMHYPHLLLKTSLIIKNRSIIDGIIAGMSELFPVWREDQERHGLLKYFKAVKRNFKIYMWIVKVFTMVFTLGHIMIFVTSGTEKFQSDIWLPFDHRSIFVYIPLLLWIIWLSAIIIVLYSAYSMMFLMLTSLLTKEFTILNTELSEILKNPNVKVEDLKAFVDEHNRLFELSREIQKVFSPMLLYEFLQSSPE
jgi:hypothetical protein